MTYAACYLVGIAGGTGAGKTTLAQNLQTVLGEEAVTIVEADFYYRDLSHLSPAERHLTNFDHPDALDLELLAAHLKQLQQGRPVDMTEYDFTTHCRTARMLTIVPRPIVIVEGILLLACPTILRLLDLKVYIDEAVDLRLVRRMLRDINERGRTPEMSAAQYVNHVRPMHQRFVESNKHQADLLLKSSADTGRLLPMLHAVIAQRTAKTVNSKS